MGINLSGVGQFTVGIREGAGWFDGAETIRMLTVNADNDVLVTALSLKNGMGDRAAEAGAKFADLSASDQAAVRGLRALVTKEYDGRDSSIGVALDKAFQNTWDAGLEVQTSQGYVRSHLLDAGEDIAGQAKGLSHHVLEENPANSGGTTFADWVSHAFRLDELS